MKWKQRQYVVRVERRDNQKRRRVKWNTPHVREKEKRHGRWLGGIDRLYERGCVCRASSLEREEWFQSRRKRCAGDVHVQLKLVSSPPRYGSWWRNHPEHRDSIWLALLKKMKGGVDPRTPPKKRTPTSVHPSRLWDIILENTSNKEISSVVCFEWTNEWMNRPSPRLK